VWNDHSITGRMRGMPKGQGYAKEYALRCKASLSGVDGNGHQGCDQVSKNIINKEY